MAGGVSRRQPNKDAAAATHLQQAVALCVQRVLELQHVLVLLGVDELIGEVHGQALQHEPHRGGAAAARYWPKRRVRPIAGLLESIISLCGADETGWPRNRGDQHVPGNGEGGLRPMERNSAA